MGQTWFPTVQEVLQADWHEVWQSTQVAYFMDSRRRGAATVLICLLGAESFFTVYTSPRAVGPTAGYQEDYNTGRFWQTRVPLSPKLAASPCHWKVAHRLSDMV